jgi:hypothetical protein
MKEKAVSGWDFKFKDKVVLLLTLNTPVVLLMVRLMI